MTKIKFTIKMLSYMGRWQLSTPFVSMGICFAAYCGFLENWEQVAIANLICAPPFYFLDRFIMVHLDEWIPVMCKFIKKYAQLIWEEVKHESRTI